VILDYFLPKYAHTRDHCKCILTIEHSFRTCTICEHNWKQYSQLLHMLLHSPNRNIFNYLTDINLLSKLQMFKARYNHIVLKVPLNTSWSITYRFMF